MDTIITTMESEFRASRRDWLGLVVLSLPGLLCSMDFTVLNVALPTLSADLAPTPTQMLWIVDIYAFVLASALLPMGTLGDRAGRRRLLMIGAAAFGCASVVAAFARSPSILIGARAALGLAGATLTPTTLSLIRNIFRDTNQRAVAIAIWACSFSLGAILGPILGGVLLKVYWWGAVFLIGVPVMALILILAPLLLPEYRVANFGSIDFPSALLSLGAALPTVYGLKRIASEGFTWASTAAILLGVVTAILFIRRQKSISNPMIVLTTVRNPVVAVPLVIYALGSFVSFGTPVLIEQYMQLVLGLSPLQSALWSLPCAVTFIVGSSAAPFAARRVPSSWVILAGLGLATAGLLLLSRIDEKSALLFTTASRCLPMLGLALVFNLVIGHAVGNAPPKEAGALSALAEAASDLGGALGIALLGSLSTAIYRVSLPERFQVGDMLSGTLASAQMRANHIGGEAGAMLEQVSHLAYLRGFHVAMLTAGIPLALTTALTHK